MFAYVQCASTVRKWDVCVALQIRSVLAIEYHEWTVLILSILDYLCYILFYILLLLFIIPSIIYVY